jgi:hypothetical protein
MTNKRFKITNFAHIYEHQSWLENHNKNRFYTYQNINTDEDIEIVEDLMNDFRDDLSLFETMRDFLEYCSKAEFDRFMFWVKRLLTLQKYQPGFIKAQVRYLCQQIYGRDFLYMHLEEVDYIMTYLENIIHWSQQKKIKLALRDWIQILQVFYRFRYSHQRSIRFLIQSADRQNFQLAENEILKYVLENYELPEYFWKYLLKMSLSDQDIVIQLTHGEKIKNIQGLPIKVSNRDVHYFYEIPCDIDMEKDYIAHGILLAKLIRASNQPELLPEFYRRNRSLLMKNDWSVFDHQDYFVTLFVKICEVYTHTAQFQMIEYLDFYKTHVSNFRFNKYYRNISPAAVLRRIRQWHVNIFDGDVRDYNQYFWEGSGLKDLIIRHINHDYIFKEIKTGPDLVNESIEMHHCVATYVESCLSGEIHIWSVKKRVNNTFKSYITMEITQSRVSQARKKHNVGLSENDNFFVKTLENYYKSDSEKKKEKQAIQLSIEKSDSN